MDGLLSICTSDHFSKVAPTGALSTRSPSRMGAIATALAVNLLNAPATRAQTPDPADITASALEQRVDLSLFQNGQVKRLEGVDADIARGRWYVLGLIVSDDHFAVSLDGKLCSPPLTAAEGRTATSPSGREKTTSRDLIRLKSALSDRRIMGALPAARLASTDRRTL
jgi:hypothetical protein